MAYDRHRATNRRAIGIALGIWGFAQVLAHSETSVTQLSSNSLAVTGLVVLPIVLAWPWIRDCLSKRKDPIEPDAAEGGHKTLVSLEIAALSAMLIFLLTQVPL